MGTQAPRTMIDTSPSTEWERGSERERAFTVADGLMLQTVADYIAARGYSPTIAELQRALRLADVVTRRRLDRLQYVHGCVFREPDASRALVVTREGWRRLGYLTPPRYPVIHDPRSSLDVLVRTIADREAVVQAARDRVNEGADRSSRSVVDLPRGRDSSGLPAAAKQAA